MFGQFQKRQKLLLPIAPPDSIQRSNLIPNSKRQKKLTNLAFGIAQKAQITTELEPIEIQKKNIVIRAFL